MRKHWIILLVAVLALAMEIACGDDDTSGLDGGADGDGDADIDALRTSCEDTLTACNVDEGELEWMCSCRAGLWRSEAVTQWAECESGACEFSDPCDNAAKYAVEPSRMADDFYDRCMERDDECDTDDYCEVTSYRDDVIADKMECLAEPCRTIQSCFETVSANWGCPRR